MRRILAVLTLALAACGGGRPMAYRPVAFGEYGHCYYAQDPAEIVALQAAGLCDRSWTPLLMPTYWHYRYWNYYSSPAYFNAYVPVATRTVFVDRERSFGTSNRYAIATEAKQATYRGSNGKVVSAEKIGVAKYGGGNRFGPAGTKFGGGARNATPGAGPNGPSKASPEPKATPPAKAPTTPAPKAPAPKAPSSGKSYGGGARTSNGGGTKSGGYGGGGHSSGGGSHSFGGGRR